MSTTNVYPFSKEMTFSTKKVLLDLAQIIYRGDAVMVVADYTRPTDGQPPHRQLSICVNGKTVADGLRQDELFEDLKQALVKKVKY